MGHSKFTSLPETANTDPEICCADFGITCDGSSITAISWANKGLNGEISATFKDMKKLKKLNLSSNDITGEFPDFLAKTSITDL